MSIAIPDTRHVTTDEAPADLRLVDYSRVLDYVLAELRLELVSASPLVKRRTVSGATTAGTWLRVEVRSERRVRVQGWGAIADAARLQGVAKPAWYRSIDWRDPTHQVRWRADETELVEDAAIKPGGTLKVDPDLSDQWWATLRGSLSALGAQPSFRLAKLGSGVASQAEVTALVNQSTAVLGVASVDSKVDEWATAHADLTWANLTSPQCWLLDWEDFGRAPRGFDAAVLLFGSWAVPALAERVRTEFETDLASRAGKISVLALAAESVRDPARCGAEMWQWAHREASVAAAGLLR